MKPNLEIWNRHNDLKAKAKREGFARRGWICTLDNHVTVRHRVRFDYTGVKGSAKRLPPDHPPWLVSGLPTHRTKDQRWFHSLEEAMIWAQGEIAMRTTRELM